MTGCAYQNLLDPDLYGKGGHQEALRELREAATAPVIKIDDPLTNIPYWAVLSRDLADGICKNPRVFSSTARTALPMELEDGKIASQSHMLVNMDPPKHQKYRRIVRNAFTPKAVDAYLDTFQRYAKEIVDAVACRGDCEFIGEIAAELPLMAILDLCGVPKEDRKKIFEWTNEMFFQEDSDIGGDDPQARADTAAVNMYFYADELAKRHKEKPLNNIVGALLDGVVEGEHLTTNEFQMFFLMLIAAGNESTRSVTAHGMRLLMEHPEQLQLLIDKPELIPDAIEEVLRYNPAFVGMRRTVMKDIEIGGQQLKKGDKVILNWHLINTDETVVDKPFEFDITRAQRMPELHREHRAFGIGQHFCLGSHLARLELNVIFNEVLPRLRNPKFAEPVKYVRDYFVNGIKEMKITFDPEVVD